MILAVVNTIYSLFDIYICSSIYAIFHISCHHSFIPHELIRAQKRPTPNVSGFIAQLNEASHRYREVI